MASRRRSLSPPSPRQPQRPQAGPADPTIRDSPYFQSLLRAANDLPATEPTYSPKQTPLDQYNQLNKMQNAASDLSAAVADVGSRSPVYSLPPGTANPTDRRVRQRDSHDPLDDLDSDDEDVTPEEGKGVTVLLPATMTTTDSQPKGATAKRTTVASPQRPVVSAATKDASPGSSSSGMSPEASAEEKLSMAGIISGSGASHGSKDRMEEMMYGSVEVAESSFFRRAPTNGTSAARKEAAPEPARQPAKAQAKSLTPGVPYAPRFGNEVHDELDLPSDDEEEESRSGPPPAPTTATSPNATGPPQVASPAASRTTTSTSTSTSVRSPVATRPAAAAPPRDELDEMDSD